MNEQRRSILMIRGARRQWTVCGAGAAYTKGIETHERDRFRLAEDKAAIASQIISATIDAGLIKADESAGASRKLLGICHSGPEPHLRPARQSRRSQQKTPYKSIGCLFELVPAGPEHP